MNRNKIQKLTDSKSYNITICILAIFSVVLAVIDFNQGLSPGEKVIEEIIYALFVLDYFVRLTIAQSKKKFFTGNLMDLIAIIPFHSTLRIFRTFKFFKVFRTVKFAKALRMTKIVRIASVAGRFAVKAKRFLNTNGFKYVLLLSVVSVGLAALCMMYLEKMSFQDAVWWSFVTTTTVGYGDLSPVTGLGRIVAAVLMLVGIGLIGSLTSSITTFFITPADKEVEKPNSEKVEWVFKIYQDLNDKEREIFKEMQSKE